MMAAHKNVLVAANIRQKNRLLRKVNEMMAAHKNAVVIANIRQKNQPHSDTNACRSTNNLRYRDKGSRSLTLYLTQLSVPKVWPFE